jgi:glycosyltransferase involved in cell wall biosynthesis
MPAVPELPPIAEAPLSIVLLARDAAGHVEDVLSEWDRFLAGRPGGGELVLVDDGSSDGTADRAEALRHTLPRLGPVLRQDTPRGEGAALRKGLEAAGKPLVFYTLCRPEYRPAELVRLLDRPAPDHKSREIDHVHLLSGYRAGTKMPWPLRLVGFFWRLFRVVVLADAPPPLPGWLGWRRHLGWLVVRALFGVRYHDPTCPCRLFRRDILAHLPIQSAGPFAHVELVAKANFLGCLLGEEVPLDVTPPPSSSDPRQWRRDAALVFNHPDFGPPAVAPGPAAGG